MRAYVTLGVCAATLALAGLAHADQFENPRTDYTAYTRPGGRAAVGPLKVELGIIDEITVGTFVVPWLAFPVLKVPIPNTYVKFRAPFSGPFSLAARGGVSYLADKAIAELSDNSKSGNALSLTADVDASYRFSRAVSVSVGMDYAHLQAIAGDSGEAASLEGASSAHTYSVRAFGEWRLNSVFAITLLFRYLIYQSPIDVNANSDSDSTSVEGDLSAESTIQKHFTLVPGVSFVWDRWELSGGVGYGVFYIPSLGLASARSLPVVDFAVAYRFDLWGTPASNVSVAGK